MDLISSEEALMVGGKNLLDKLLGLDISHAMDTSNTVTVINTSQH